MPEVCTQVDSTWARPEAKVWKRVENQADPRGSRDSKARLQRPQRPRADWCWGAHLGWALGCWDKVGGLAQPSLRASLSAPKGQRLA